MDINDIEAKASAKIDQLRAVKIDAVKAAATSGVRVADAIQALASAEQEYAKDYQAALRASWTESDLKGFGLEVPAKRLGGRPRGTKSSRLAKPANLEHSNVED